MSKQSELPNNLKENISSLGTGSFVTWLSENNFILPKADNLYDSLQAGLDDNIITLVNILAGISELEENSDKNIFLFHTKLFKKLYSDQQDIIRDIRKDHGYKLTTDTTVRITPGNGPTFIYMNLEDDILKFKFSEIHFDKQDDPINDKYIRVPKIVNIYLIIELKTGFAQIRLDSAGQIHTHKNDLNNPSDGAFKNYYKDLFLKLFSRTPFEPFNLTGVANYIRLNETERFLMQKMANTVSDGVKQSYSMPRRNRDVRQNIALIGAAATDKNNEWLTEDISGYWLEAHSEGRLTRDLFMRLYRRDSEIRVQRGCLKKELDYGISTIREIQATL